MFWPKKGDRREWEWERRNYFYEHLFLPGGKKVAEARKRTGPDDHAGKILEIGSICNRMVQISYLATFKSFCTLGARYEFRSKNLCDST